MDVLLVSHKCKTRVLAMKLHFLVLVVLFSSLGKLHRRLLHERIKTD